MALQSLAQETSKQIVTPYKHPVKFYQPNPSYSHHPFALSPAQVFDGIDTIADVRLNGHGLPRVKSMHVQHVFEVGGAVRSGRNELRVLIRSTLEYAKVRLNG